MIKIHKTHCANRIASFFGISTEFLQPLQEI